MSERQHQRVCWNCYGENTNFSIILEIINGLKHRHIASSQKNILERLNIGSEVPEISAEQLNEVLLFAQKNKYIELKTYKNNLSYRVNTDYLIGECVSCGDLIENSVEGTPSDTENNISHINDEGTDGIYRNQQEDIYKNEYVNIKSFQILLNEVNSLKQSFNDITKLREDNKILALKLQEKDKCINSLAQLISNLQYKKNELNTKKPCSTDNIVNKENKWNLVNKKNSGKRDVTNICSKLQLTNRFDGLTVEESSDDINDINENIASNSHGYKQADINAQYEKSHRPQIVTNDYNDNGILIPRRNAMKFTNPGNSTYANITHRGDMTCIVGDSICRPINMLEFDFYLDKGTSRKRCYGGETVSRLNYCIEGVLNEDLPDRIVLCMGTNNLTKKSRAKSKQPKKLSI